jgi:UDP-N-acetylglucosamine--N-acetylmuramyl-(pentapeptide) pyrophosphoryl-undecaprenol N-acetylglucosamine transferase
LDLRVAEASGWNVQAIAAAPLRMTPSGLWAFWRQFQRGRHQVGELICRCRPVALLATGGFVSGPAVAAARKVGLPAALVSLDAVPGRANRLMAKHVDAVFTVGDHADLPDAQTIGFPLRREAVASTNAGDARRELQLGEDRPTLLIFAGSQGARTINRAMIELVGRELTRQLFADWQIFHIAGSGQAEAICEAYDAAGIVGRVVEYCQRMDLAWAAADLAITRAGAGTVAEAWANAVPCVMLPYPYHKDQHQKHNTQPMVQRDAAVVLDDQIEPWLNADAMGVALQPLLADSQKRRAMRQHLMDDPPADGAAIVADWVQRQYEAACGRK